MFVVLKTIHVHVLSRFVNVSICYCLFIDTAMISDFINFYLAIHYSVFRIQLEHSGRILEVGRKDCVLMSADELASAPFTEAGNHKQLREEQQQRHKEVKYSGVKTESVPEPGASSSSSDGKIKQEGGGTVKTESKNSSSSSSSNKEKDPKKEPAPQTVFWLREGIRVKIISKSLDGGKSYLQKGTVLDVYSRGKASVRLDDTTVIDSVNERHVETIMPSVGGACVVLLGEYKGQHAVCMEKRNDTQRVIVQLNEDLDVVELDMDSIAARG